jgi:hypothetical protein
VSVLAAARVKVERLHGQVVGWIDRATVALGAPASAASVRVETDRVAARRERSRPGQPTDGTATDVPPGAYVWRAAASRRLREVMRLAEGVARPYIGDPDIDQAVERLFTLVAAIQELLDLIESEGRRIAEGRP